MFGLFVYCNRFKRVEVDPDNFQTFLFHVFFCFRSSILSSTRSIALPTTSPYDFSSAFMQKGNNVNSSGYYNNATLGSTIAQGKLKL